MPVDYLKKEKKTAYKLILVGLCYLGSAATATESAKMPERWPLSKILKRATENSPSINAMRHEVTAAENKARQAGRWDNPEFSANLGQKSAGTANGRTLQVSVLQGIPLFGQKGAAERVGHEEQSVVQTEYRTQQLLTGHLTARQVFKFVSVDEQMKYTSRRREKILLIEDYLRGRPFASPSQAVEKNLIQNRLREIEEKFIHVTSDRESEWQSLNVYLGLSEPIQPDVKWATTPSLPSKTALQERIEKENPEIVKQSKVVLVSQAEIDKAGKKAYPEIKVGGGYAEDRSEQTEKNYYGALQFTIPLFDGGTYGVEEARAKKEAETSRFEQRRREVASQFEQAWLQLIECKKRVELFPLSLIPKLETQMARAEQNWKKGLVRVTEFLELENQVNEQTLKVFESQTAYADALSQLFLLSGQSFPEEEK